MRLNQTTLIIINVMLLVVLLSFRLVGIGVYPPVEEMITRKVVIVSVNPQTSSKSRDGRIEVYYNNKKIKLSSHLSAQAFDGSWDILGREAVIMIRPGMKYGKDTYPAIAHLEIVGGKVILDYKKTRDEHVYFMTHYYQKIMNVSAFLFLLFFFLLIRSLRKTALSSRSV